MYIVKREKSSVQIIDMFNNRVVCKLKADWINFVWRNRDEDLVPVAVRVNNMSDEEIVEVARDFSNRVA